MEPYLVAHAECAAAAHHPPHPLSRARGIFFLAMWRRAHTPVPVPTCGMRACTRAGAATPDRALPLHAEALSADAIRLTWDPPTFANGAPAIMYDATCADVSGYLSAAASAWQQPAVTRFVGAPSDPAASVTLVVDGLSAGTTYQCRVASNNSVGGFAPVFDAVFADDIPTHAAMPDAIGSTDAGCTFEYDTIDTRVAGAPSTLVNRTMVTHLPASRSLKRASSLQTRAAHGRASLDLLQ